MSQAKASARLAPHMAGCGISEAQTPGRSGRPNSRQRSASSSCTQRTPAGLPAGMPGMGELIDGAVQQAPQAGRQCMRRS
jgi:hypothetical protein